MSRVFCRVSSAVCFNFFVILTGTSTLFFLSKITTAWVTFFPVFSSAKIDSSPSWVFSVGPMIT